MADVNRAVLTAAQIDEAADMLFRAEREAAQIRATSVLFPDMTMADAYRVQEAVVARKTRAGRRVVGHKIGLTSRAMQQAMNIDEPDYGTLLDDMMFENDSVIEAARFPDPRIEVELAFVLGDRLVGADIGVDEVLAATRYVIPALELIAARSHRVDPKTGHTRGVVDTIADNAASAGVVLGERLDPGAIDMRWCGAILTRNGEVEETGLAAGVLGHPAQGAVWLARRFAAHGIALEPGEIVLTGSFTRPVAVRRGDDFTADFGPCGVLACRFV
ncbi:MAG: 2-oxo-hept-4-ene-1,7-dioate hydratase [Pseudomonadota bacterium]